MAEEIFDIINEQDAVIATATRSEAHKLGLRHRAIHVLFITPKKEIILQRRSMSKDTFPGYLTVTVGGHVSSGGAYDTTAVTEVFEETGLRVTAGDLIPVAKLSYEVQDPTTGAHDCESVQVYGHVYKGDVSALRIEANDGAGFEVYALEKLMALTPAEREREKIVPILFSEKFYVPLYGKFLGLVK